MEHHPAGTKSKAKVKSSRKTLWVIAAVAVGALAAAGIFYLYILGLLPFFERDRLPEVHGRVYFTGATSDYPVPHAYFYDFDTNTFELAHGVFANDEYAHYTPAVSPSGNEFAYFNAIAASTSPARPATEVTSLYSTLQLVRFTILNPEEYDVRTPDAPAFKVFPEWSPVDRTIAYEAYVGGPEGSFANLEDWGVYLIEDEGVEEQVATGATPKWAPDGRSFVYMKEDGLYQYDTETTSSKQVLEFLEPATWGGTRFDISRDGTKLVLTPEAKRIELYEVTSWEPFTAELMDTGSRAHVRHWWPQFSPDGEQVAVIDWEQSVDAEDFIPVLTVYGNVGENSLALIERASLEEFSLMAKFVSEWW